MKTVKNICSLTDMAIKRMLICLNSAYSFFLGTYCTPLSKRSGQHQRKYAKKIKKNWQRPRRKMQNI